MANRLAPRLVVLLAICLWASFALADQIEGRVVRVADGDTLTVLDSSNHQHRVRIAGIDAPEKGQPWGQRSKQNLAAMAFEKQTSLDCYKRDRYKRSVCRVFVEGRDIGLEQIRVGLAWWYRRYANEQTEQERQRYEQTEAQARTARLGLWGDESAIPPWEWRGQRK
jgi:endonuclease YncB( thermonuclease family)